MHSKLLDHWPLKGTWLHALQKMIGIRARSLQLLWWWCVNNSNTSIREEYIFHCQKEIQEACGFSLWGTYRLKKKKTHTCIKAYFCWPEWEYVILLPLQHPPPPPNNSLCSFYLSVSLHQSKFLDGSQEPCFRNIFFFFFFCSFMLLHSQFSTSRV